MNMNDASLSWYQLIKQYIDGLGDEEYKDIYKYEVVARTYFDNLMAAAGKNQSKDLEIQVNKLKKIPLSGNKLENIIKNVEKLEEIYDVFIANGWASSFSHEIDEILKKDNFYNVWICRAVAIGSGAVPGTHIAKLSHSSSAGSSIIDDSSNSVCEYLTTGSLRIRAVDGTYPDAKLSKQVKFLLLELNGVALYQRILNGDFSALVGFEENDDEIVCWGVKFKEILSQYPASDFLLKQIYFPVNDNYHLLTVLNSSSLSHEIYNSNFSKDKRDEFGKLVKLRKANKYSEVTLVGFPRTAKIFTTRSQPQNSSVLNGRRGGAVRLFATGSPAWKSQVNPPINRKSWFDYGIPYSAIKTEVEYIREFLLRFESIELSVRDPKRKKWLVEWAGSIVDDVLFYAGNIQSLPAGWTNDPAIKLKSEHQYFLDPYREDELFQGRRSNESWQAVVCLDFAGWLNKQLKGGDSKFTPQPWHTKLWVELMEPQLRELNETLGFIHAQKKENI